MWIKICGNTNLEDAQLAVEAGADAVGFVFAESLRRVDTVEVSRITPHLPHIVEKIGVFVDASFEEIARTATESGLTGVQLHVNHDRLLPSRLRDHFGPALRILQVVHYAPDVGDQLDLLRQNRAIDAVLIDSRTAKAVGGTGTTFDWRGASRSFHDSSSHLRLIAAGGLSPENVVEAIRILRPWGVDVVTGVESVPGRKDPDRVKAFIAAARTVAEEVAAAPR